LKRQHSSHEGKEKCIQSISENPQGKRQLLISSDKLNDNKRTVCSRLGSSGAQSGSLLGLREYGKECSSAGNFILGEPLSAFQEGICVVFFI